MEHSLFAIYDSKAKAYQRPFTMINEEVAVRAIQDALTEPTCDFAKYPSDYTLFKIGTYDEQTSEIKPEKTSIGCLVEFLPPVPKMPEFNGEN